MAGTAVGGRQVIALASSTAFVTGMNRGQVLHGRHIHVEEWRHPSDHLCAAAMSRCFAAGAFKETAMKKVLVAAVIIGSFISFQAQAQERAGSAALGAVSGAIVLGPVGAVAGALIGYTAGPAIAHSWGVRHSARQYRVRRTGQSAPVTAEQSAVVRETPLSNIPENPPPVIKAPQTYAGVQTVPPVQGLE